MNLFTSQHIIVGSNRLHGDGKNLTGVNVFAFQIVCFADAVHYFANVFFVIAPTISDGPHGVATVNGNLLVVVNRFFSKNHIHSSI